MTEFWVSSKRHYCDICKCWLSGNAMNVANHAKSEAHQANQQRMVREMHQRERQRKQDQYELSAEIRRIEAAGHQTFLQKDLGLNKKPSVKTSCIPGTIGPSVTPYPPPKKKCIDAIGSISAPPQPSEPITIDNSTDSSVSMPTMPSLGLNNGLIDMNWIMSVDPITNTPFYFNTITGQTRTTDPNSSYSMNEHMHGTDKDHRTIPDPAEQKSLTAIASLLPSVNDMASVFKAHILSNKDSISQQTPLPVPEHMIPTSIFTAIDRSVISSLPESLIERHSRSVPFDTTHLSQSDNVASTLPLSSTTYPKNVNGSHFIPSINFNGSRPDYIFTTRDQGTGYYFDSTISHISSHLDNKETIHQIVENDNSSQGSLKNDTTEPSIKKNDAQFGCWEEVSINDSKFGDCVKFPNSPSHEIGEGYNEDDDFKSLRKRNNCNKTYLETLNDVPCKPPTTSEVLIALKEDADASDALNADDSKRQNKIIFGQHKKNITTNESIIKEEDTGRQVIFKKRLLKTKPLGIKIKHEH